ncbi:MAG: ABC transporter ATP-binding protein [Anaerolineae bacterium]
MPGRSSVARPSEPLVQVVGFHYAYPTSGPGGGSPWALQGVDLTVQEGEVLALMGPTGAGKSTLCMALAGLVPHTTGGTVRGDVRIAGHSLRETRPAALVGTVGLAFQDAGSQLFNATVETEVAFGPESLGLPPAEIARRVAWALGVVRLTGLEERSPFHLSGGQQKRLALASVLAMRPRVLVLDEPLAGLDPVGREEVLGVLLELREASRATIVLAEQDSEAVAHLADRVVVLAGGRVVLEGSPREVFSQVEALREVGLRPPQVVDLGARLGKRWGREFSFLTLQEADTALRAELAARRPLRPREHAEVERLQRSPSSGSSRAPALRVEGASYCYPGGVWGVREADLQVPPGEFLAVVGQNGAGKSTLARLLNGLLRPTRGQVWVGDVRTAERRVGELARWVGFCFQNPDAQIFSGSVLEEVEFGLRNLGLPPEERRQRAWEALGRFGLSPYAEVPPALLGFGDRRKVTLASLYAMRPPVWVLDEPTAGLDARTEDALMDLLHELHTQGHTVLFITHDMRLVAAHAPRVLVMGGGRVLWQGATRDLFRRGDVLAEAHLVPPQITTLSLGLEPLGVPAPALTVDEFLEGLPW